jgi:ubiquinone/menaquinone biosynthesis C-methylase UbiE
MIYINETEKLKFETQDAKALTYADNSFDLVYSISVLEHIYDGFLKAVEEMIRVVKPGGYIYISFPVSSRFQEEWLNEDIYSNQFKQHDKIFFQYRFDETSVESHLMKLEKVTILEKKIYWEKKEGKFNEMVSNIRNSTGHSIYNFWTNSILNLYYGFTLLNNYPENFDNAKDFGNISIIMKKNNN